MVVSARALIVAAVLAIAVDVAAQPPQEIRLWSGKAPGSENWSVPETTTTSPSGDRTIANVSDPSVTVYLPAGGHGHRCGRRRCSRRRAAAARVGRRRREGCAVVEQQGDRRAGPQVPDVAVDAGGRSRPRRWCARRAGAGPAGRQELDIKKANANPAPDDAALTEVLQMGVADAQQALRLARRNAAVWRIDPARIGIMGFSAGGGVAVGTALAERSDASPDFLVSVYGPSLQDVDVPAHAPPLFIGVGSTHFNVTNGCLALFAAWKAAGKPAEIHVYDQVSGGFGMSARGLPVDSWNERLLDWLVARKLTRR